MKSWSTSLWLTALGALLALAASGAHAQAQQDAAVQGPLLEEVLVTATRRELSLDQVAAAITVVDEEAIESLAPQVFAGALRGEPGVFFQQTTPGQGIPIVRGLKGSQVLHLVDGIRINNAFFRDAPNQYLGLVDSFSVERIELIRGAAGSLYGADAMGGVVQLVTKEARFDDREPQARGRLYGSFDSADDGWVARAEAAYGSATGSLAGGISWQDRGDRRIGGGATVVPTAFESRAGDLRLLWTASDAYELMFSVQSLEQPSTPRIDELVPGFGETEPSSEQYRFEPNRRDLLHGRWRWFGAGGSLQQLTVQLARQRIVDDRLTQSFGSPTIRTEQNESVLDGLTVQADHVLSEALALTWGAEVYRDKVRSVRQIRLTDEDTSRSVRGRFPDGSSLDSDSAYVQMAWTGAQRLSADAGLRYSRFQVRLPETPDSPAVDLRPDDFTGDLRLRYELNAKAALLSNIGRGFRPPNVFDLGTLGSRPGNRFNIPNPNLGPETVWSYDLGLRLGGDSWQLDTFVFFLDYRDKITSVLTGNQTADGRDIVRAENRNRVQLSGLELNLDVELDAQSRLFASLNYIYGEEDDGAGMQEPADRVPPLNGRLGFEWTSLAGLSLRPYLLFAGPQDRLSDRDERDPRIDPTGTDGWLTANVQMSYALRPELTLGLRLENLFDKRYREHGSGVDAAGFNAGLWLDYRF